MAISIVQSKKFVFDGVGTSGQNVTFDNPTTTGNLILVIQSSYNNAPATPTDNKSNTFVSIGSGSLNPLLIYINAYCKQNATGGSSHTITVSAGSGSGNYFSGVIVEISGAKIADAIDSQRADDHNTTTSFVQRNLIAYGDSIVFAIMADNSNTNESITPAGGWTTLAEEEDGNAHARLNAVYKTVSGAQIVTGNTWTIASSRSGCSMLFNFLDAAVPLNYKVIGTNGAQWAVGSPEMLPAALYDATSNKTFFVYQGTDYDTYANVYDHATDTMGSPVLVGASPLTSDSHGAPCLCIDSSGYLHVFSRCHSFELKHAKSNSARSVTAWTEQSDPVSQCTYPNVWKASNGNIILFYRGGGHAASWYTVTSTDDAATWGSPVELITSTSANVWYLCTKRVGDTIHFSVVWKDETNTFADAGDEYLQRYGNYYFKYNALTGVATNAAGTSLTLPLTKATLDTHCVVRAEDHASGYDNEGWVEVGADGNPAILLIRGRGLSHTVSFTRWNGSAWTSPVTVTSSGVDAVADSLMLLSRGSGKWTAVISQWGTQGYYGDNDTSSQQRDTGGSQAVYQSGDNGATWTFVSKACPGDIMAYPQPVQDGISPCQFVVADWVLIDEFNGRVIAIDDPVYFVGYPTGLYQQMRRR